MPTTDLMRSSIFNYMKSKNGNIIAVIDSKKGSITQYIQEMQKETTIVGLSEKGTLVADSLRIHLKKIE